MFKRIFVLLASFCAISVLCKIELLPRRVTVGLSISSPCG